MSALNMLRRDALKRLDSLRSVVHNYTINNIDIPKSDKYIPDSKRETRIRVTDTNLSPAFKESKLVFVPLFSDQNELRRLLDEGYKIGAEIPRGMFGMDEKIAEQLKQVKSLGITDVLCNNIGALYLAKKAGMTMHGGFGLNLVNTYDLLWAEEYGIKDVELSFELTFERINALGGRIPRGIISYGYLPLMLCRCCPNRSAGISCQSCKNRSKMTDRKGEKFFLKCDCTATEILNCVPLFIDNKEISKLSTNFNVLRFSVENYVENVENVLNFTPNPMLKDKFTRGLYRRGVN